MASGETVRQIWPSQPLRDDEEHLEVQIYAWPDGSDAILRLRHETEMSYHPVDFIFRWADDYGPDDYVGPGMGIVEPVFSIASFPGEGTLVAMDNLPIYPERLNRKILGLLLDIGIVEHPTQTPSIILNMEGSCPSIPIAGAYPRWVSDELWDSRFELAREYLSPDRPYSDKKESTPYRPRRFSYRPASPSREAAALYGIEHFQYFVIRSGKITTDAYTVHPRGWTAIWGDNESGSITLDEAWSDTFEEAVDGALSKALILPMSQKEQWESENIERGTPTLLSQEEIEVFNILEEPLPYWWGYDRLLEWLRSRG
jgi:hypothetical protein